MVRGALLLFFAAADLNTIGSYLSRIFLRRQVFWLIAIDFGRGINWAIGRRTN